MYTPSDHILEHYATVLVNFALHGGQGVQAGEVVQIRIRETARPLLPHLVKRVLLSGAYPLVDYLPEWGYDKMFFETANEQQLAWFADAVMRAKIATADHTIIVYGDEDPHELESIDPQRLMLRQKASKVYRDLQDEKEHAGKFTRTLALYPTEGVAREAGMSLEEYRDQVINACFLDEPDPVTKRQEVFAYQETVKNKLNALQIQRVHLVGEDVDLHIQLGSDRQRLWGSGRNIPSFELFISPDRRGTEWWIRFSEPLYHYGKLIKGVQLWFEKGKIVKATATEGEAMLLEMIATENADKIGEFSLTDKRLSRIRRFMADTLYDENVGGPYGNTHIAIGDAYKDSYTGDPHLLTKAERAEKGFNESVVHTDIVSTTDRTVTAVLPDGTTQCIYADGQFLV